MMEKKRTLKVLSICLLIFCGILLLSRIYRCPLYSISGIPCPGCGMTRAFLSLLKLDFGEAWQWNPAVYLILGCAGYAVICCLLGRYDLAGSFWFWGIAAGVMVMIWLVRFPDFLGGSSLLTIREGSVGAKILESLFGS